MDGSKGDLDHFTIHPIKYSVYLSILHQDKPTII